MGKLNILSNNDLREIEYLNFSKQMEISLNDKSKVIFGYNGIGKTSIYKKIMEKHSNDYAFLDYEKINNYHIDDKKNFEIGCNIRQITELEQKNNEIDEKINVSNTLKEYGLTNATKVKKFGEKLKNIKKNKAIESKLNISDTTIKDFDDVIGINNKQWFINKYDVLKGHNIQIDFNTYLNYNFYNAYKYLDNCIEPNKYECPVCEEKSKINIKEIIENKKKEYSEYKEINIFEGFIFNNKYNNNEQITKIIGFINQINEEDVTDLIICDFNIENKNRINKLIEQKNKNTAEINELMKMKKKYYTMLKSEKDEIINFLSNKFNINNNDVEFDDGKYSIRISLPRNAETYSNGEFDLLTFFIGMWEFQLGDKKLLIIDDPISSYDIINQYITIFRIAEVANEEKKILIFTHNIELINAIISQNPNGFEYQYIERYDNKLLVLQDIFKEKTKPLSIRNLDLDDRKKESNYLYAIINRNDKYSFEKNTEYQNYNKLFHYDEPYQMNVGGEELSNDELAEYIENYNGTTFKCYNDFLENSLTKIIYIMSLRVWIEKKIYKVFENNKDVLKELDKKQFYKKISIIFNNEDYKKQITSEYKQLTKKKLMQKKTMLNQNDHFDSQILPFYYALNISIDDLKNEIRDIKDMFNRV